MRTLLSLILVSLVGVSPLGAAPLSVPSGSSAPLGGYFATYFQNLQSVNLCPTGMGVVGFDTSLVPQCGYLFWELDPSDPTGNTILTNKKININNDTIITGNLTANNLNLNNGNINSVNNINVNTINNSSFNNFVSIPPLSLGLSANYLPKAAGFPPNTLGNSQIYDNGTNVGIGTTSPSAKLHIPDGARFGNITIGDSSNQYGGATWPYETLALPNGNNFRFLIGGVERFRIEGNGDVIASGNARATGFFYTSDERMKRDITALEGSLEKIQKLSGYSYVWRSSGKADVGVIAQDVERVYPDLVHTDSDGMKSVEYGNLVAPLIEAIKEQQKEIDSLTDRIRKLESIR